MKRGWIPALVLAAVAMLAAPAGAKGFSSATFFGPGLPAGGLRVHGRHGTGPVDTALFQSGVFNGEKTMTPAAMGLRPSDLGPSYRMVVTPDWDASSHIKVTLYPYAKSGPWSYTPSGQNMGPGELVPGGWWQIGHRTLGSFSERIARHFMEFLVREGFPATAPEIAAPAAVAPVHRAADPTSAGWPAWSWVLVAALLGGLLVAVAARERRRVAA